MQLYRQVTVYHFCILPEFNIFFLNFLLVYENVLCLYRFVVNLLLNLPNS